MHNVILMNNECDIIKYNIYNGKIYSSYKCRYLDRHYNHFIFNREYLFGIDIFDNMVYIHDIKNGNLINTYKLSSDKIYQFGYYNDIMYFCIYSNGKIKLLDINFNLFKIINVDNILNIINIIFKYGKIIIFNEKYLYVYDIETLLLIHKYETNYKSITSIYTSNKYLIIYYCDNTIKIFELQNLNNELLLNIDNNDKINNIIIMENKLCVFYHYRLNIYNINNSELIHTINTDLYFDSDKIKIKNKLILLTKNKIRIPVIDINKNNINNINNSRMLSIIDIESGDVKSNVLDSDCNIKYIMSMYEDVK